MSETAATELDTILDRLASENEWDDDGVSTRTSESTLDEDTLDDEAEDLSEDADEEGDGDEESSIEVTDDLPVDVGGDTLTLGELKKGYQRQADYTRKTQELASIRQSAEQAIAEATAFNEEAQAYFQQQAGDRVWAFRQLHHNGEAFDAVGANQSLIEVIYDLAASGHLDSRVAEMLGIDPASAVEIARRNAEAREGRVLKLRVGHQTQAQQEAYQRQQQAAAEQQAVQSFEDQMLAQLVDISYESGLDPASPEASELAMELLKIAQETENPDLKVAYRLYRAEQGLTPSTRQVARQTVANKKALAAATGVSGGRAPKRGETTEARISSRVDEILKNEK